MRAAATANGPGSGAAALRYAPRLSTGPSGIPARAASSPHGLAKYRAHLDWMEEASLGAAESRDFIHAVARQL